MKRFCLSTVALVSLLAAPPALRAADADPITFFESKIRPVLVEKCYRCHAQDTKQRGGLRLDERAAILLGGDHGPAVVPRMPNASLLIKALRHQGPKMPPQERLSEAIVADFVRWVEMGVPDPRDSKAAPAAHVDFTAARRFWSFQAPHKPTLPKVQAGAWPRSAIDHFILARLEAGGLHPVQPAGKRELIRRATFDLLGLAPTPEEVESFVHDQSADAFAHVIDRLLASPHYGERWGRHWLDVARFAEDQAHTFGVRPNTSAYRYRDWVFKAINDDMPYDRFVKLQIAADLLPGDETARIKDLPALGFFGLGAQYYKDNTEIVKAIADELDERVDTLSRGLLGLTVACARCHDHKFDPIPTLDYYSLAGVFRSSKLADVPLATRGEVQAYEVGARRAREAEDRLKTFVRVERAAVEEALAGEVSRYLVAVRKLQERRTRDAKWCAADQATADGLVSATLERWLDYLNRNSQLGGLDAWRKLPKLPAVATDADVAAAAMAFQSHVQTALGERNKGKLDKAKTTVLQGIFGDKGVFALTDEALKPRLPADKRRQLEQCQEEAIRLRKSAPEKIDARFPVAHAIVEGTPADMPIYLRGNPRQQGAVAPRRFLRALAGDDPPRFAKGSGRLELAEAIASKDNPLTARVIVNRAWQWHFGRGIVDTPSNFGALGDRPTHPELLDYLACRLVESGWSLKALHREIMLSATYQLSCADDEHNAGIDADNRLHWRMNQRRLDVESWRDAILFVSGRLDPTAGGPTTDLASPTNHRRTAYCKVSRHDLNGLLRLFDFPDANITSEKRTETTVPQQQLFVLNSQFLAEQARGLAARLQTEAGNDAGRVRRAYALVLGRPADADDLRMALYYLGAADAAEGGGKSRLTRWERFAQALLASNEFMYVD